MPEQPSVSAIPANLSIVTHDTLYDPLNVISLPEYHRRSLPDTTHKRSILTGDPSSAQFLTKGPQFLPIHFKALAKEDLGPTDLKDNVKASKRVFSHSRVYRDDLQQKNALPDVLIVTNRENSLSILNFDDVDAKQAAEPIVNFAFHEAWPLCFDFNKTTISKQNLDLVIGLSNGKIVKLDLVALKYKCINVKHNFTHAPVTAVKWVPGSKNKVLAAHSDGFVLTYDFSKEDGEVDRSTLDLDTSQPQALRKLWKSEDRKGSVQAIYRMCSKDFYVTTLKVFKNSTVLVAARDEFLKVFHLDTETLTDLVPSFFGGVHVQTFTSDRKYIIFGSEDGAISVLNADNLELVVRLVGHTSCIKAISSDRYADYTMGYRLASIGEDRRLLIWDFTPNVLNRPKLNPAVELTEDQLFGMKPSKIGDTTIRKRYTMYDVPSGFPLAHIRPVIPQYGEMELTDVKFSDRYLHVAAVDGKIWTWKKKANNYISE